MKKKLIGIIICLVLVMVVLPVSGNLREQKSIISFSNDGTLSGYVNDTFSNPISGALIRVYFHGTYEEDYSDSQGFYHVTNIPICYCMKNCTCYKEGFEIDWIEMGIDEDSKYDFVLHPIDVYPTFNGSECGGWWNSPVTVSFVFDPEEVVEIWYDLQGWDLYTAPFIIDNEGIFTIYYYWIDNEGVQSPIYIFNVNIDQTPPNLDVITEVYREFGIWWVHFHITAEDTISGVDSLLTIYINDGLIEEFEVKNWSDVIFIVRWSRYFKNVTIEFGCYDNACNYVIEEVNGSDIKSTLYNLKEGNFWNQLWLKRFSFINMILESFYDWRFG
jgi:hypothetical protein